MKKVENTPDAPYLRATALDAQEYVYAKATYYSESVRIFIPNVAYLRQKEGYETNDEELVRSRVMQSAANTDMPYETNEERSLRRSRKALKDYALCNDFDLFATFTFADDRHDDERSVKRIRTWIKNQRTRNGKFGYLIVTERHKDGALHFHALFSNYTGKLVYAINPNNGKYISDKRGGFVRNFAEFTQGLNTAKTISSKESRTKTAYYLQKYMGKDMTAAFGKNRYWASAGLNKPIVENNPQPFYEQIETPLHWVSDHGTVLEFEKGFNPITDAFIEAHK